MLELVDTNLDFSLDASRHLLSLVKALKAHDNETVWRETATISELESKADGAHMKAVEEICSGSFFGGIREDLLNLLEQIDNIADSAKNSSRVFRQRKVSEKAIDYFFREDAASFIEGCVKTVELFKVALESLGNKTKNEVIELATEVERSEERVDAIRGRILENLLRNEVQADPLDIVMLKDSLDIADNIADCAEDGSDVILVLVAKGYT